MTRRITMADVARLAGVSAQTVSRVLNSAGAVSETTRDKVQRAIEVLDYHPNLTARALAKGASGTVGLLTGGPLRHGLRRVLTSIQSSLADSGVDLIIAHADALNDRAIIGALDRLHGQQVDGVIGITRVTRAAQIVSNANLRAPTVLVTNADITANVPTVSVDNYYGGLLSAKCLLDIGVKNPLQVTGPLNWEDSVLRLRAYQEETASRGIVGRWIESSGWDCADGYQAGQRILSDRDKGPLPDGIIAANDDIAIGLIHALVTAGVRVPDDVVVIGYDNIPETEFLNPPLTTVLQDFNRLGNVAVELLQRVQQGESDVESVRIEPELIIRESTRR